MSALPPEANMLVVGINVCLVPIADMRQFVPGDSMPVQFLDSWEIESGCRYGALATLQRYAGAFQSPLLDTLGSVRGRRG